MKCENRECGSNVNGWCQFEAEGDERPSFCKLNSLVGIDQMKERLSHVFRSNYNVNAGACWSNPIRAMDEDKFVEVVSTLMKSNAGGESCTSAARNRLHRFVRWLIPCRHVCDLSTLHTIGPDHSDERVQATCSKCGNVLRGPFGLALPCAWTDTPNADLSGGIPSGPNSCWKSGGGE